MPIWTVLHSTNKEGIRELDKRKSVAEKDRVTTRSEIAEYVRTILTFDWNNNSSDINLIHYGMPHRKRYYFRWHKK